MQPLRHYQEVMALHSPNDHLMCHVFSTSLKGIASDWFYLLSLCTLRNFEKVSEAFLTQYASRKEIKKNNNHLLSVRMRPADSLKGYMNHFQNQLTRVHTCSDNVATLAFINGLQSSHPRHKHLLKYNIMQMKEVCTRAQQYIQLEEAIKGFFNPCTLQTQQRRQEIIRLRQTDVRLQTHLITCSMPMEQKNSSLH